MPFVPPRPLALRLVAVSLVAATVLFGGLPALAATASEASSDGTITVDGYLHVDEWQEGADQPVEDEGWVRMERRDDGLYLAVRTNKVAVVDVFVHRDDELHQLHASGQVGGALFKLGEDQRWHLAHSYPWIGKEAKPRETQDAMRDRLRSQLKARKLQPAQEPAAPEPPTMPPSDPPTAPDAPSAADSAPNPSKVPPKPPTMPPVPPAPEVVRDSAEDIATVAKHLEDHGWTATLLNMGGPPTAEFFLSNDFLRPGDRILVQWPFRSEKGFGLANYPEDADRPPAKHSAAFESEPFTLSFDAWHVVE